MIELRPHIGIDNGGNQVTLAQDQIFDGARRLGYVGHSPGSPICLIVRVDDATRKEIESVVAAKHSQPASKVVQVPEMQDDPNLGEDDE